VPAEGVKLLMRPISATTAADAAVVREQAPELAVNWLLMTQGAAEVQPVL